jgi:hypothetical protein
MGRHINAEAGPDGGAEAEAAGQLHDARHAAEASHPLEAHAVISPDTHVGVDLDQLAPGTAAAPPSPANPDALVEHGMVGDGHEME